MSRDEVFIIIKRSVQKGNRILKGLNCSFVSHEDSSGWSYIRKVEKVNNKDIFSTRKEALSMLGASANDEYILLVGLLHIKDKAKLYMV